MRVPTDSSTSREQTGLVDSSWSGDATAIDVNDDGWLDLYLVNMQGDNQYYENVGGKSFVRKSREVFPRTSWGAMGIKVVRLQQRRTPGHLHHRHALRHERGDRPRARETEVEHAVARSSSAGTGARASGATRSSSRKVPSKFREVSDALGAGELLSVGTERRRSQCRRIRRCVHRVRDELSPSAT